MQWAGHVTRMPDSKSAKKVLVLNPVGTGMRGAQ